LYWFKSWYPAFLKACRQRIFENMILMQETGENAWRRFIMRIVSRVVIIERWDKGMWWEIDKT
jgi:hypothetical protein